MTTRIPFVSWQKEPPRRPTSHSDDEGGLDHGTLEVDVHESDQGGLKETPINPPKKRNRADENLEGIPGTSGPPQSVSSSNSDDDYSPSRPKQTRLLPRMDKEAFDALYYRQHPSHFEPRRKVTKILPKQTAPGWMCTLGDPKLNDNRKWDLQMPDCLIAHVAGHKPSPLEFNVSSKVDLLAEIFDLASSPGIPTAPSFGNFRPNLALWYSSLKNQFKLFALS